MVNKKKLYKKFKYFLGGQPALSSIIQCSLEILDVNDHKPEFLGFTDGSIREIIVEENVAVGHELGRVFAVDSDSGKNGEVHYKIFQHNEIANITDLFDLNENTGILKTKAELDREIRNTYKFQVYLNFYL